MNMYRLLRNGISVAVKKAKHEYFNSSINNKRKNPSTL